MHMLTDPILQDVVRTIERHPSLTPEFRMRLLDGLARIDAQLADYAAETEPTRAGVPMKARR